MGNDLISVFAKHRVAANILMLIMMMMGLWGLSELNTQFLPNFELDVINVTVVWPGATAEDVERSITLPLEQELKNIYNIHEIKSVSVESRAQITMEFEEGSDMGLALDDVKEQIGLVRNLPIEAEEPEINRVVRFENIAQILLTGPSNLDELRAIAYDVKRDLLNRGIAKVDIKGLPEQELAITIGSDKLFELNRSLPEIAQIINQQSINLPAGTAGRHEFGHSIRSPEQIRSVDGFGDIAFSIHNEDEPIRLKEIASIHQRPQKDELKILYENKPAVELTLLRTEQSDSLEAAKLIETWFKEKRPQYGDDLKVEIFNESWKLIEERIFLLLKNGLGGLILILIILFLLLERHIAFWVAVGIPVSLLAAMGVLFLFGGSINMVSLFAMIMTLGIIVDDTIVVGENAYTRIQKGMNPLEASIRAGHSMFVPVMASSLTTISAFLPLMLISGVIGNILFDIPFVAICVIVASLFECFLVLPGHIYHSFHKREKTWKQMAEKNQTKLSHRFTLWREIVYRRWIIKAVQFRWISLSLCVGIAIIIISLPFSGRVKFQFFPSPDSIIINANIQFINGTPEIKLRAFLEHVHDTLRQTQETFEQEEGRKIVQHAITYLRQSADPQSVTRGPHVASLVVELVSPDARDVTNHAFIKAWRDKIQLPAGIENFKIFAQRGGPPGQDIDINLIGESTSTLKQASLALQDALNTYVGVFNIQDNLPYGKPQLVYRLTPQGEALGLTLENLGQQLRSAIDGNLFQIFNLQEEEVEVRLVLPQEEQDSLATLSFFPIKTPGGKMVPLNTVARFEYQQGLETIHHTDALLTASVTAEVDSTVTNANLVLSELQESVFPNLIRDYGIDYQLKGRAEEQAETFSDMGHGVLVALTLIYLILAWVFSSYLWPFAVMAVLPFGIVGAILGHWILGIELTILSLFGFFGLSGIVVNDSIILVTYYKRLRRHGVKMQKAVVEASISRLRAVLLTSLTTIAGLTPLLFETSLQAQFLIPMAVSISFGLFFATFLVLFIVPILLYTIEHANTSWRWHRRQRQRVRTSS